jgi:uncharacterized membrane protein (DUF106 family)
LNLKGEDSLISKTLKKQIDRLLLAFGFSLMSGIVVPGQDFRQYVGKAVGVLMNPVLAVIGQENFHLVLLGIAAVIAIYSSLILKYTIDRDLMRNTQELMKLFQKIFREAQLSRNIIMLGKFEEQHNELMKDHIGISKKPFKPLAYISIISTPLLMWACYYINSHGSVTMIFPFWGKQLLTSHVFGPFQRWIYWYFISSLGVSQLTRKVLNIVSG